MAEAAAVENRAKPAQGARYGAEAPHMEWLIRRLGVLGSCPGCFSKWQTGSLPTCPTAAAVGSGVLGSPTLAVGWALIEA